MENTKIENISDIKLDFFLKQNKKDARVVLGPGDISWCDLGSSTKSMILYARKNLIKLHDASKEVEELIGVVNTAIHTPETPSISLPPIEDAQEITGKLLEILVPNGKELTALEKAEEETRNYTEEKEEKKYKGKKRGRKKKRGPKPGSKRKKPSDKPTISDTDTIKDGPTTGFTTHLLYSD